MIVRNTRQYANQRADIDRERSRSGIARLHRERQLVAGTGQIAKERMAIAFGIVFLGLGIVALAGAGNAWAAGGLALFGILLSGWGLLKR